MKVELEVAFNIGDKVLVKQSSGNASFYGKGVKFPIKAVISGYVITKDTRRTTVYYFIEPLPDEVSGYQAYDVTKATSHKRRYPAKWLEKLDEYSEITSKMKQIEEALNN